MKITRIGVPSRTVEMPSLDSSPRNPSGRNDYSEDRMGANLSGKISFG